MLPRGILFDLDDTIVAFDAVAIAAWRRVCEEYARESRSVETDALFEAVEEMRNWVWSDDERAKIGRMDLEGTRRKIVRLAFERLGMGDMSAADKIGNAYSVEREKEVDFLPGAEETLEYLCGRSVALALITNGEGRKQRDKVQRFRLGRFFKTILIEGELGYGKPEEKVYRRAMDDLGLSAEDVWAVGDNLEWDVAGPQRLGIFSIWNDWKGEGLPEASKVVPDRIINRISELME